ncbi:MAG: hypothetical protein LR008_01475 [Candidatus Pacebacteria bacterium]|nr:hypothetical protein [Candidatus Paceibacterota bacterium]
MTSLNLGLTVSKHLFELFILLESSSGTLKDLIDKTEDNVVSDIKTCLKDNLQIIEYALSLKLPLIQPDGSVYLVEDALVPGNATTLKKSSLDEIEKYIKDGWVDLRAENILNWIKKIVFVLKDIDRISHNIHIPLERNWRNITESNVGELLGYIYSMDGGSRKKEIFQKN